MANSPTTILGGDTLDAAARGSEAAFEEIFHATSPRIYTLCYFLTGSHADAADVMQEVYIKAWRNLGGLRDGAALLAWLRRLAVNVVSNFRRSRSRSSAREDVVMRDAPIAVDSGTDRMIDRIEFERVLATLPDGARVVFVLYDIEGWTHAEIAAQLGITEGGVRAQLHRARTLLRNRVAQ